MSVARSIGSIVAPLLGRPSGDVTYHLSATAGITAKSEIAVTKHAEKTTREVAPSMQGRAQAEPGRLAPNSTIDTSPRIVAQRQLIAAAFGPAVQRQETLRAEADRDHVRQAARLGLSGASQPLPHLEAIQKSFGRHDVSHVKAHLGSAATAGAEAMGAEAYATGDQAAFRETPSLHTAAHEAAHVVQQQAGVRLKGGVGEAGDEYERHAEAVANGVVQGRSVEGLLDAYAEPTSHAPGGPTGETRATQLRKANAGGSEPPVQAIGWRTALGLAGGALVAGIAGAAATSAGGLVAGTALGVAGGAALGRRFGRTGAVAGGAVGGLVGLGVGSLLSAGALLGGVAGAVAGGITGLRRERPRTPTLTRAPAIGQIVLGRAMDLERSGKSPDPKLQAAMEEHFKEKGVNPTPDQMAEFIEQRYAETIARPGAFGDDVKHAPRLTKLLFENPFIKRVLSGDMRTVAQSMGEEEKDSAVQGGLQISGESHTNVELARQKFNQLVGRKLPAITSTKRDLLVESAMGENELHLGLVSPPGAILHELGHHLEHNLSPVELGSLHNFLRARSPSDDLRPVGYERLLGAPQNERGYSAALPALNLNPGANVSVPQVLMNTVPYAMGNKKAEMVIERHIMGHANTEETSYATQIYSNGRDTEFLSTSIHFFSDPAAAAELITKDPLRVCLFLSFAQPQVYRTIKAQLANDRDHVNLDNLIHKLNPEPI